MSAIVINGFETTGFDFEEYTRDLLEQAGFHATRTGNHDYGVDIIAEAEIDGQKHVYNVQCKFYNKPLGNAPIQQVLAGTIFHKNGGHPVVITNHRFTVEARTYAAKVGVELIGSQEMRDIYSIKVGQPITPVHRNGLFGAIIGGLQKDTEMVRKAFAKEKEIKIPDSKEKLKDSITSKFDEANALTIEEGELYQKAMRCRQKVLALQKEALIQNLGYL